MGRLVRRWPAPGDIGEPQPAVMRLASEARSPARCSMRAAEPATTHCTSRRSGSRARIRRCGDRGVHRASASRRSRRGCGVPRRRCAAPRRTGREFDTVLDCALLHTFDRDERREYVASLASVTRPGGAPPRASASATRTWSDGPSVGQDELRAAFGHRTAAGASAPSTAERLCARFAMEGVPAWLASVRPGAGGGRRLAHEHRDRDETDRRDDRHGEERDRVAVLGRGLRREQVRDERGIEVLRTKARGLGGQDAGAAAPRPAESVRSCSGPASTISYSRET